jgi:transposase
MLALGWEEGEPMPVIPLVQVDAQQRTALESAARTERRVRVWRRFQAVLLLADGQEPETVARALGCGRASVYSWAAAWREAELSGLQAGKHAGGRPRRVDAAAETLVRGLLRSDPQQKGHASTGWTVPLLRAELAATGVAVAERTIRRTLHRLGWRWKRPKYVLGRPDPAYAEKKRVSQSRRRAS